MSRFLKILIAYLLLTSCSSKSYADSIVFNNVTDLNTLKLQIIKDTPSKESTLVIFDIDDTLLESVNFVGSGKWYNWQRGRTVFNETNTSFKIDEQDKFYCMFRTLGTLFEIGSTKLTQTNSAELFNSLNQYDLMILTARTTTFRDATERELINNNITQQKHLSNSNFSYLFNDNNRTAKVTYENGIAMLSGLNKGLVLKSLLKKMGKSYQNIYFIDDSKKNIDNMAAEWKGSDVNFKLFHYTKVSKLINTSEVQESIKAKKHFDQFLLNAYPDRFSEFKNNECN